MVIIMFSSASKQRHTPLIFQKDLTKYQILMTGSGSPCGACKFLRRKCVKGCVFAPYFCHEQGATQFAAIHRVFGASNVSKLLSHLPICDRSEAAATISYEAQARLQDPIYGCVSHIFALQQQVVSLQSQLVSLREQAAQRQLNVPITSDNTNPNTARHPSYQQTHELKNWFQQSENSWTNTPQYNPNTMNDAMNFKSVAENYNNSLMKDEDGSFSSFEEGSSYSIESLDMQISSNQQQWAYRDYGEDLQSVAFGYTHN
ncbi:putative transcription factor AS2-LOB family [Helianthus debilis subsp. tardiflorus]